LWRQEGFERFSRFFGLFRAISVYFQSFGPFPPQIPAKIVFCSKSFASSMKAGRGKRLSSRKNAGRRKY
jgi:hypothetical protein